VKNDMVFRASSPTGTSDHILFRLPTSPSTYFDDITVTPITHAQAATRLDEIYAATMQPFNYGAFVEPGRFQYIPRSYEKLRTGQPLNVVLLGDSIIADTGYSYFEPLVERNYPGSRMNVIPSWKGSTGSTWYKDNNRVRSYVLNYNPDLVMIGGDAQRMDMASIHTVIQQIQTARPDCEIVLMTEAAGWWNSPYINGQMMEPIDPNPEAVFDYRAQLWLLAQQDNVGFLDMTAPWMTYIYNTGMNYDLFLKDGTHCNALGEQILEQIMVAYFTPVPEPSTLVFMLAGSLVLLQRKRKS
jgi:hypothetical protein